MADNEAPTPAEIRLEKGARALLVVWSDGIRSRYPWSFLRANCPSAGEKTAREHADPLAILAKVPSGEIVDIRLVGNYALNFTWGDGHNAGIYTWEYLRRLSDNPAVESTAIV